MEWKGMQADENQTLLPEVKSDLRVFTFWRLPQPVWVTLVRDRAAAVNPRIPLGELLDPHQTAANRTPRSWAVNHLRYVINDWENKHIPAGVEVIGADTSLIRHPAPALVTLAMSPSSGQSDYCRGVGKRSRMEFSTLGKSFRFVVCWPKGTITLSPIVLWSKTIRRRVLQMFASLDFFFNKKKIWLRC